MQRHDVSGPQERQLDKAVRQLCKDLGLYGFHPGISVTDTAGLPDWIIIGKNGILWRENKAPGGQLTSAQRMVGHLLLKHKQNWGIWSFADLESGRVRAEILYISGKA